MMIQICGPGCAKCDEAYQLAQKAIQEADSNATIEKVTDFKEIAKLGVFSTPAIVIDGVVKCVGRVPTAEELKSWLS